MHRRSLALGSREHPQLRHDAQHTLDADVDGLGVEPLGLARLVHQHALAKLRGGLSERLLRRFAMDHDRRAERLRASASRRILEVAAHLRQIDPIQRTRVQVDAVGAAFDDLGHEQVGKLGCQRAARGRFQWICRL
ncbi:MAG: hypothetical protein P8Y07_10980 [Gemmatimonadales bacterium]